MSHYSESWNKDSEAHSVPRNQQIELYMHLVFFYLFYVENVAVNVSLHLFMKAVNIWKEK